VFFNLKKRVREIEILFFSEISLDRLFLSKLKHVVLDEADTLADDTFGDNLEDILGPLRGSELGIFEFANLIFILQQI